jgi:hypothetical protein
MMKISVRGMETLLLMITAECLFCNQATNWQTLTQEAAMLW